MARPPLLPALTFNTFAAYHEMGVPTMLVTPYKSIHDKGLDGVFKEGQAESLLAVVQAVNVAANVSVG